MLFIKIIKVYFIEVHVKDCILCAELCRFKFKKLVYVVITTLL
jgi:hypothetical protein